MQPLGPISSLVAARPTEPSAPFSGTSPTAPGAAAAVRETNPGGSFVDLVGEALGQLNAQLVEADAAAARFASGASADLHTVMLEMQEATLGLRLGLQVRDRLLEAYHEIMRLQI